MSKLVKNMLVEDLRTRLSGVGDLIVVSLGKLDAIQTSQLRQTLRKKKIHLQMVKNSLARRATLVTPLAPAFEKHEGMLAIAWGGEDVVDLAKELDRLSGVKEFAAGARRREVGGQVAEPGRAALAPVRSDRRARQPAFGPDQLPRRRARRPDLLPGGGTRKVGGGLVIRRIFAPGFTRRKFVVRQ